MHEGFEVSLSWAFHRIMVSTELSLTFYYRIPIRTSYARGWPQVDFNGGFFWQLIAPLHLDWPIDGADDGVPILCICR